MTKINLSEKEKMLLEDQKKHEEICVQKYTNYADQTQCPELKSLFKTYASEEQQHYNTINQILSGQVPNMQQGQNQQMASQSQGNAEMTNKSDASLCADVLMAEKFVSGAYDTAIFECRDTNLRNALNHIQKEEQQHDEGILITFKVMACIMSNNQRRRTFVHNFEQKSFLLSLT